MGLPAVDRIEIPVSLRDPVTPLRYPGGKQKLTEFLRRCVVAANDPELVYLEPYAGGAGAALALLKSNDVSRIVINDLDPAIYAFWHSAVHQNAELSNLVSTVDVTLEEWLKQREVYRATDVGDLLSLGFATLFLNRTSRSGVLGAGVIGGMKQEGAYKVDARFYRSTLIARLQTIQQLAKSITVTNMDGIDLFRKYSRRSSSFFYIDPPYYEKGGSLYLNAFEHQDHMRLAACLNKYADRKWIMTYDRAPEIVDAYKERRQSTFWLRYSAHRVVTATELFIASDGVVVPGLHPGNG
ncbi:DNA adenine methylase [Modestobacter muralis]|uniref:site-specific DNA-methyltransferase (adenine-specific) n=1 Tax=Modestobacter muralis TaxID=1608614 RepID=A0A6P0EW30_9ACTN|nr:DNA adenine methylase [Modestobacter muralis]NEK93478.1 DNA adenine methylase [Modestobacter muralis]NEN50245.1 DNA adenine methylase [Modestobacter muralis]